MNQSTTRFFIEFDALSIYKKYTDLIKIADVPEAERKEVAHQVADKVLSVLKKDLEQKASPAS